MDTITIQQVITWGIPILIASVGATFAITKYNNANARRVLEDRLKLKEDKIKEYAVRLSESQHSADSPLKHSPVREMNRQLNGKETSDLTNQIDALEAERDRLLSELSNRATASLDPRSELSNLLSQLKSADKETRNKAVQGLFALKDPLSFIPLVNYLENHTDEATKGSNVYLGAWFTALIQIGGPKGAEYIASHTESTRQSWSEAAFSNLQYTLSTPELIDGAIPALERCALTHPSTFTRTQAKVLIQHLQSKRREYVDRANALKEQERLIEEQAKKHEQWVEEQEKKREQKKEQEKEIIPSDFIIISALKHNDLNHLAHHVIHSGQVPTYWRAGAIIAEEYVRNESSKENCIQAIRQIVETAADFIAKTSHSFLLYLLSQMEAASGDAKAAKTHLNAAHELSPAMLKFLNEYESAFQIKTFTS